MKQTIAIFCLTALSAFGSVESADIRGGAVFFKLTDGTARLDWLTPATFRWVRVKTGSMIPVQVDREPLSFSASEREGWLIYSNKYIIVEVSRMDAHLRILTTAGALLKDDAVKPLELRWGSEDSFVLSIFGYGELHRAGANATDPPERLFYYGPSLKEVLEQHMLAQGQPDGLGPEVVEVLRPSERPRESWPPANVPVTSWEALRDVVRRLIGASMTAILYPSIDLQLFSGPVQSRAEQLATLLPIVVDSRAQPARLATRDAWKPYLITYFREARDRGFPLIRPLMLQFPKDPQALKVDDQFLIGDELLVAPILSEDKLRSVYLPMGIWTDLRTNREYKGRQSISVDVSPDSIPVFAKNGSLVPIANGATLELHYFPKLGSEFFLWEPERSDISQFHANPILGDILRFESEAKIDRVCEWVAHHYGVPKTVNDATSTYTQVLDRRSLKPGMWFHDRERNNLHVMSRAAANGDEIINVIF